MSEFDFRLSAKALTYLICPAEEIAADQAVTLGLASNVLPQVSFAADADDFVDKLAARPRLVLETIKRYQARAGQLAPEMASEYAGTLRALVCSGAPGVMRGTRWDYPQMSLI